MSENFTKKANENIDSKTEHEAMMDIIITAAKLIKKDIKEKKIDSTGSYNLFKTLSSEEATLDLIPASLQCFLREIFVDKSTMKMASIGQAIVQAARPSAVIAPLQLGHAVQLHNQYWSKNLIDLLHAMGFCSSYDTVSSFEENASICNGSGLNLSKLPNYFVHFVADNADHNTCTIDERNTFHVMGLIVVVTPGSSVKIEPMPIYSSEDRKKKTPERIAIVSIVAHGN